MILAEQESHETQCILPSPGLRGCQPPVVIKQTEWLWRTVCWATCLTLCYLVPSGEWLWKSRFFFHDSVYCVCLLWEDFRTLFMIYTVQEIAHTLHVCVCILIRECSCSGLRCVTLLVSTDEIRCLSAGASQWLVLVLQRMHIQSSPTPRHVMKGIVFTQHFRLNKYYLYRREER